MKITYTAFDRTFTEEFQKDTTICQLYTYLYDKCHTFRILNIEFA